jgi:energy-coupling factor transport system ATP-binding protein
MMQTAVEIKNVTYRYKGAGAESLDNISLTVNAGEALLLCGASGSGKTSVIRLINGLIPHYYHGDMTGNVTVKGRDIANTELYELAGIVGTVFQNPRSQFFSVDTDGEIAFGPENIGLDPKEIRARTEMTAKQMHLEKLLGRSLFELSGGEKQRIACASVAALLPEIILLDEPSSNLDWETIGQLREIIGEWKRQGKTIIISEHRLWYLKGLMDRVVYMDGGKIICEWPGAEFENLSEDETKAMKLRPTVVKKEYTQMFEDKTGSGAFIQTETSDGILLKDFYFSYHHRPYVIRKKPFSSADGEALNLCIPKFLLPKGKIIGVVGRNGTGKSTFLRCLCGLEKDCTGVIVSDGKEYRKKHRIGISYMVMQDVNHQLFTDSVEAEVMLSMKEKDEEKCHAILDDLGLLAYKDTHPMALSGGQKQRVAIASAVAAGAKLLLFDEPTSGLDYAHMVTVGELLKQLANSGSTVLVSTHDPELIELSCDYILRIKGGKVDSFWKTEKTAKFI